MAICVRLWDLNRNKLAARYFSLAFLGHTTAFFLFEFSRTFTYHRTAGKGEDYFFNSTLPLPPASQALRHYLGDYCRELTSTHSQQPDSNLWFPSASRQPVQSDGPLALFFYQDLEKATRSLMQNFITTDIFTEAKSTFKLTKIDLQQSKRNGR